MYCVYLKSIKISTTIGFYLSSYNIDIKLSYTPPDHCRGHGNFDNGAMLNAWQNFPWIAIDLHGYPGYV